MNWEEIISQVRKPGRYLGNEINAVHKDLSRVKTKLALIFPDMYELGMSHLGLKILYHLLNQRDDVAAERAYAPGLDMEAILRREQVPLVSLESHLPLKDFDIVGFTLPYEMGYTNVLNILDLAQIPLLAEERDDTCPLIIAGGTCTGNPEPMADFFDLFVLGDGEEVILELVDAYQAWQDMGSSKQELLQRLSQIEGIYVPSLFEVNYNSDDTIAAIIPKKAGYLRVQRRIVVDLDQAFFPIECITPHLDVVHDRLTMEIARGCTQGCRFCQAGITYRPTRQRSAQVIASMVDQSLAATGYEEVSLSSLSTGDYGQLPQLLEELAHYPEQKIAISLSSLRPGTLDPSLVKYIKKVRQTGFTIAPEAGTERLRGVINKGITEEDILQTVDLVFANGWQGIKLYFMIGLPSEEETDLEGIVQLVKRISRLAKQVSSHRQIKLTVAISGFVPKAHTPFQWVAQNSIAELKEKQNYLKDNLPRKRIKLKWHDSVLTALEGVLSRGDRRLGAVILRAWQNGARFDQWSEHFNHSYWEQAFIHCNIKPEFYAQRQRSLDEIMPWQHLDMGVSAEFLRQEYQKSLQAEFTTDCRKVGCHDCGISRQIDCPILKTAKEEVVDGVPAQSDSGFQYKTDKLLRYRVRFSKLGDARFLSHLDLVRLFSRALRRAQLPICYSRGFHPHMLFSFSPALSIGVESEAEYIDFELFDYLPAEEFGQRLNRQLPPGLHVYDVCQVPLKAAALAQHEHMAAYSIWVPKQIWANGRSLPEAEQYQRQQLASFLGRDEILITRKVKNKVIDVKPLISIFRLTSMDENGLNLELILKATTQGSIKPQEVVQNLYQISGSDINIVQVKRRCLWFKQGQHFVTPLSKGLLNRR